MIRFVHVVLGFALLAGGAALAKLPPPTPEEQAAVAEKKAREQEQLKREAINLEKAQDRLAQRYKKGAHAASGGKTRKEDMPKTTAETPRGVGPTPDKPTSGEAHSAPAK